MDWNSLTANIEIKITNKTCNHYPYRRIYFPTGSLGVKFRCLINQTNNVWNLLKWQGSIPVVTLCSKIGYQFSLQLFSTGAENISPCQKQCRIPDIIVCRKSRKSKVTSDRRTDGRTNRHVESLLKDPFFRRGFQLSNCPLAHFQSFIVRQIWLLSLFLFLSLSLSAVLFPPLFSLYKLLH